VQNATGGVLDPFSSFLALRGLGTLPLQMERHAANALTGARLTVSNIGYLSRSGKLLAPSNSTR